MQPRPPPDRIRQAAVEGGFIEDHVKALAIVEALRAASTGAAAIAAARHASAFLEAHMAEEEEPDGVFDWLGALDASLAGELHTLSGEHVEIRAALATLTGASEGEAIHLARELAVRLELHEAAERRALDKAMGRA